MGQVNNDLPSAEIGGHPGKETLHIGISTS
jgi:hypothetical protein